MVNFMVQNLNIYILKLIIFYLLEIPLYFLVLIVLISIFINLIMD